MKGKNKMASRNQILVSTSLYHIGVVTLMAALVWIAISAYALATKPNILDIDPAILEPINPVLNKEVLSTIMTREKVEIDLITTQTGATPSAEGAFTESDFVPESENLQPVDQVIEETPSNEPPVSEEFTTENSGVE